MLVLTRRLGETLLLNDDIKITILNIRGNQVGIGIAAPDDVKIYREEVYERIMLEERKKQEAINE